MVLHKVFGVERDIDIDVNAFPTLTELEELEAPLGKHEHGWFDSCILLDNGVPAKLHYRCFLPTKSIIIGKKPKAIVIYLHGGMLSIGCTPSFVFLFFFTHTFVVRKCRFFWTNFVMKLHTYASIFVHMLFSMTT